MGHDAQDGKMFLNQDRLCFSWPGIPCPCQLTLSPDAINPQREQMIGNTLLQATTNLQGSFIEVKVSEVQSDSGGRIRLPTHFGIFQK
jgi:hypothetical protein